MKFTKRALAISFAILITPMFSTVHSGATFGTVTGKVVKIRIDASGKGMIFFDKPIGGGTPSCAISHYASALAIDASTDAGKAVLSLMTTAKVTESEVIAHGFGRCETYSVVEEWNHGFIL